MKLMIINQREASPGQTEHLLDLEIINRPKVFPRRIGYQVAKRMMDVTICLLILPVVLPLMFLCALAIYLDSFGPVFFVQERVGKGGHKFRMYKFRTMCHNLDDGHHRAFMKAFVNGQISNGKDRDERRVFAQALVYSESAPLLEPGVFLKLDHQGLGLTQPDHWSKSLGGSRDGKKPFKPARDSDVTRVGRILRKTSLDELPQIINVLKGEMSVVGPRPNIAYEVEEYRFWHHERLEVLPGITGLAQVRGRSSISFDCIVKNDIEYIEKQGLALDLKILWWSLTPVLHGTGAE
jgi:lipopolysaccharide/colanic/teichoic acid biosynthesis glycosyltransferase